MEAYSVPAAPLSDPLSAEGESTHSQQNTSSGTIPGAISVEFRSKQGIVATTSSSMAVSESPKVSKMVKSGLNFVIPKNKLLGAVVPVNRTATKWEPLDVKKEEVKLPARKSKWGPDLTQDSGVKKGRALALQTRAEQLSAQLESGNLDIDINEDTRSPSPPPLYDALGHRMNTREVRKREQLDLERREAIGECMKLNPLYKPPSGFKPITKEAKLYIPVKENPGYNFIGLILGPRGNTQKRMEAETGAKITIRGKGAVKEGKMQAVRNGKDMDGASEELHVHVSADTYEKVDAAAALIEPLLTPVDEDRNMHKMKQLRELAEMNGTLNDFTKVCGVCGESGHREWQCSKEKLQNFQANVRCHICGDGGHPTIDCPRKTSGQRPTFDKEYLNFLEELGTGLEGVGTSMVAEQPPGPNASQPMLLTTLGAQPIPPRWMAPPPASYPSAVSALNGPPDGTNALGTFPRFPAPPISQFTSTLNPFAPRFFHQSGAPSHAYTAPPVPMVHPVFRGQSPNSSVQLPSSMGLTAVPTPNPGILPLAPNHQIPGQALASDVVGFSSNPNLPSGSQPAHFPQDGSSNIAPLSLSSTVPSSSSVTSNTNSHFPSSASGQLLHSVQAFPPTSASNLLPAERTHPGLPLAPALASMPPQTGMHLMRPVIPSIRPALPSSMGQGSNLPGPLQATPSGVPLTGGTGSVMRPPATNAFPRPLPPVSGSAAPWGPQGQYPGPRAPQQVALPFDRPPPAAIPPLPQLPAFNSQPFQAPVRSSPPLPMTAGHSGMQGLRHANTPQVSSSLTPPYPQLAVNPNPNRASQSSLQTSSRPFSPALSLGSQMRAGSPVGTPLSGGGIASRPALKQMVLPPQENNFLRPHQGLPRSSALQNPQLAHQGNSYPQRPEFPWPRPGHMGVPGRAEFRHPGLHQQGILVSPPSILGNPVFNRPLLGPSEESMNRVNNPNFPGPVHSRSPSSNFAGIMGASWEPHGNRPEMQQMNVRPAMAGNKGWNADPARGPRPLHALRPQMPDVDPEYEKLMASVGVL